MNVDLAAGIEGHAHESLRRGARLAARTPSTARRSPSWRANSETRLDSATRPHRRSTSRTSSSASAPVTGGSAPGRVRRVACTPRLDTTSTHPRRRAGPGHEPLPVQQGDQRLRRPQPARLRRDRRRLRRRRDGLARGPDRRRRRLPASAPIYSLLKRPDERHVTMQAYENPAFVEDIARDVAVALREDARIESFAVTRHEPREHPRPQRRRDDPWAAMSRRASEHGSTCSRPARARQGVATTACRAGRGPLPRPAAPAPDARRRARRATSGLDVDRLDRLRRPRPRCRATDRLAPYEQTFQGMSERRRGASWRERSAFPATCGASCARPADLHVVLLGEDYLDACELADDIRPSAPALVVCAAGTALRLPPIAGRARRSRSRPRTRGASHCGLVGLEGRGRRTTPRATSRATGRSIDDLDGPLASRRPGGRARSRPTSPPRASSRRMRFYFPDSQDQIDPSFDFETEERSPFRIRQRDDLYAHEVLDPVAVHRHARLQGDGRRRRRRRRPLQRPAAPASLPRRDPRVLPPRRGPGPADRRRWATAARSRYVREDDAAVHGRRGDRLLRGLRLRRRHLARPRHPRLRTPCRR